MAAANVMVADSEEEARFQLSTLQKMFAGIVTNQRSKLMPPEKGLEEKLGPMVWKHITDSLEITFAGTAEQVADELLGFAERYALDEIITVTYAFDPAVRKASIEALGRIW